MESYLDIGSKVRIHNFGKNTGVFTIVSASTDLNKSYWSYIGHGPESRPAENQRSVSLLEKEDNPGLILVNEFTDFEFQTWAEKLPNET